MRESALRGLWLAMDTSTSAMTIALFRDGELLGESHSMSERNHSIRLIPAIEELTDSLGVKVRQLDGVTVGHGPGSYTGIRIGVTVAKTFAWSLKLPVIGISSLEAMAYGAARRDDGGDRHSSLWVVPLMDARRGKVYTGLYRKSSEGWVRLEPDGVRLMDTWLEELMVKVKEHQHNTHQHNTHQHRESARLIFAGDVAGFMKPVQEFRKGWPGEIITDDRPLSAVDVGLLAIRYGMEASIRDGHRLEPNYTQLSEPEKKWMAAKR